MAEPILVLNCGSSSIKYQMIDAATEEVMAKGLVQRIGERAPGIIHHRAHGEEFVVVRPLPNHAVALKAVVNLFHKHGPDLSQVEAVAHRTVHGGTKLTHSTVITEEVIATLTELSHLAPLHNPPAIEGIRAALAVLPDVPHIGVFDTAFFTSLPAEAYTYAIDTEVAAAYDIRRYGFHGTSHKFVSGEVSQLLARKDLKQIVCHLGNGASVAAIDSGQPVETSMGLTPLQGLVMGTRPGDIDPGLPVFLVREAGMSLDEVDTLLNKRSGMLGLTGHTDMRDVSAECEEGNKRAILGMDVYVHRLVFYIGAYHALLGGLDTLTFTAGVGENSVEVRAAVCGRLGALGVVLDAQANAATSTQPRVISAVDSRVTVLVVPTNEELAMAREALRVLQGR